MKITKSSIGLSLIVLVAAFSHASCQPEGIQDSRSAASGGSTKQPATGQDANADDDKSNTPTPTNNTPTGTPPAATPAANFTMTWDVSTDAAITAYKVFVVPPDRNPRFPGKLDVPIQVKNLPVAGLTKNGTKYSVAITSDEVKTALGTAFPLPTTYCFSIVSVNAVGNSSHSPVICP